jgi:Protein of unknown function (DUF664)
MTPKEDLQRYLQRGREDVLWKLEGVAEYDARRPLTPTGTNLLGLVKHLAYMELEYFGAVFGRPSLEALAWDDGMDPNVEMWATAAESRETVVARYRRAWAHADATIGELPLDAVGSVPWWPPDRREVTLHQVLVHATAETQRHAGHADIVRELVDGAVGLRAERPNLPEFDAAGWQRHRDRLEDVAREACR